MKILIIGSKGFIGSHCVSYFKKDHDVWGCDVVHDYLNPNHFTISGSYSDFTDAFTKVKYDVCINCSGAASVPESLANPLRDYELNTANVFRILDSIRKFNPDCKFITLSSAAVYGNPRELPINENHNLAPVSPYGKHKLQSEEICREFYNDFGIQTCTLRIFSAYGPRLKKQLFWDLYQRSRKSHSLELFGTGRESRDFIFISDIIEALRVVIDNASFCGEAINVASGEESYIEDAARIFLDKIGWNGQLSFSGENRAGDPINWKADITRLKAFGFSPKVTMNDGLMEYAKWLNENK